MENEIWKDISGYEGLYQVSNYGRVKVLEQIRWNGRTNCTFKGKILKTWVSKNGYECISLNKNKTKHNYYIHRLVAKTFIPNPNNLAEVNHKDYNKLNNQVSNLEWCSGTYNKYYSQVFSLGGKALKGIPKTKETKEKMRNGWKKRRQSL